MINEQHNGIKNEEVKVDMNGYKCILNDIAFQNLEHFIEYSISHNHLSIIEQ